VHFGKYLLFLIQSVQQSLPGGGYTTLRVGNFDICIDLLDPRFLQVVHDLQKYEETYRLHHFLKHGDTFIDVGANQGSFSVVASHMVGDEGRVIAFEPQERLAVAVKESLLRSPASFEVHPLALGDHNGTVDLIIPKFYSGQAGLYRGFSGTNPYRKSSVLLQRLDDVMESKKLPGEVFLKLDIEGGEYLFVKGALQFIELHHPLILMEVNPAATKAAGTDPSTFVTLLSELHYTTYVLLSDLSTPHSIEELSFDNQRNIVLLPATRSTTWATLEQ
jgi:FkbM family methyltransferase